MRGSAAKYGPLAERWGEEAYADAAAYLAHRADLVVSLGPRLEPGERVLDLACGDGGLGDFLRARGLGYAGIDASPEMVAAGRRRGRRVEHGDLNDFRPDEAVAATTCFRAIYYARDRAAFFRLVASYTERKLVFDLNPRQFRLEEVRADLEAAGLDGLALRPFFSPQRVSLPGAVAAALRAAERSGPLARAALRFRFTLLCAVYRKP